MDWNKVKNPPNASQLCMSIMGCPDITDPTTTTLEDWSSTDLPTWNTDFPTFDTDFPSTTTTEEAQATTASFIQLSCDLYVNVVSNFNCILVFFFRPKLEILIFYAKNSIETRVSTLLHIVWLKIRIGTASATIRQWIIMNIKIVRIAPATTLKTVFRRLKVLLTRQITCSWSMSNQFIKKLENNRPKIIRKYEL